MKSPAFLHFIPRIGGLVTALILIACAARSTVSAADVNRLLDEKFNKVDTNLALWNIQPGLGTVMMEYSNRLARIWFAANADNWDMAKYQLAEMTEIQEVGETTRPARAPLLKSFEGTYLSALEKAIDTKDKTAFTHAFNETTAGCNACHTTSTATNWTSFQFIHIQPPMTDPAYVVDWKGGGQDNTNAIPSEGPTTAPTKGQEGNLDQAGVIQLVNTIFNQVDTSLALWNIQPGLGTVMMEYSDRFSRMYFAANAGNWDMAKYQLGEMTEIQEVGETTRPKRAPLLKSFEGTYLSALEKAIDANDTQAFDTAYRAAADGCNACHTTSSGSEWKSFRFIQVQVPTADDNDNIAWAAGKLTGNVVANPVPAATIIPSPPLTGALDIKSVENLVDDKFNKVDTTLTLWNIQPGLGTVMMEYAKRFAQIKFAIDGGNWDMAKYQLDEALEIQEVGETTRPKRAPMLKSFEDNYLKALDDAIAAKDSAKANTALTNALGGCNACHTANESAEWASFGFIHVQLPKSNPADYIQWDTKKGTGNYKP